MAAAVEVKIPLLNANEPEAFVAALHVKNGQQVAAGDLLCTLETTKSANELESEAAGYVADLRFSAGQTARAGERFCYLAPSADWAPPADQEPAAQNPGTPADPPDGLRITQPALALAQTLGLDLTSLPVGPLVTENDVRARLQTAAADANLAAPSSEFDPTAILVYGGGGHGKALIDLLRVLGIYRLVGVIDDNLPTGGDILGVPILGGAEHLPRLHAEGVRLAVNAVGGIGRADVRLKVFQRLAGAGFVCPAVVHPTAFVEASAALEPGVQVMPFAYIGSSVQVGFGSLVNTGAIVSHDCKIEALVNLSPGAILAGEVQIGAGSLVGMGANINLRVKIGPGARIGNGAVVKADAPARALIRAGAIWPD